MNIRVISATTLVLIAVGCTPLHKRVPGYFGFSQAKQGKQKSRELTPEQREYLGKYCTLRARVFSSWNISPNATPEEARARLAPIFLKLPKEASWQDVLAHPLIPLVCTEERRIKFAKIFCKDEKAGWLDILATVEHMRKTRNS